MWELSYKKRALWVLCKQGQAFPWHSKDRIEANFITWMGLKTLGLPAPRSFLTFGEIPSVLVFIGALFVFFLVPRIPFLFFFMYQIKVQVAGILLLIQLCWWINDKLYLWKEFFLRWGRNPPPPRPSNVFQFWENVTRHGNTTFEKIQERKEIWSPLWYGRGKKRKQQHKVKSKGFIY